MLTCAPQYDNNTTVESAHGRYNAPKTWLIVNTTFTYSYYERLHTDYLDKRNLPKLIIRLVLSILPQHVQIQRSIIDATPGCMYCTGQM